MQNIIDTTLEKQVALLDELIEECCWGNTKSVVIDRRKYVKKLLKLREVMTGRYEVSDEVKYYLE